MDDQLPLLLAAAAGVGVWHACTTLRLPGKADAGGSAAAATPPAAAAVAVPTGAGAGTVMGNNTCSLQRLSFLVTSDRFGVDILWCGGWWCFLCTGAGILHPGSMGASIGFNAKLNGARVVWAGDGRSRESFARAVKADLEDVSTLERMVEECSVIVSVCPPAAALEVASSVAALTFSGTFVDANAIAPGKTRIHAHQAMGVHSQCRHCCRNGCEGSCHHPTRWRNIRRRWNRRGASVEVRTKRP
jgi:hypothetical protein